MKFKLEIKMDNAAFESMNGEAVADILTRLAGRIAGMQLTPRYEGPFYDVNGNKVGGFKVVK